MSFAAQVIIGVGDGFGVAGQVGLPGLLAQFPKAVVGKVDHPGIRVGDAGFVAGQVVHDGDSCQGIVVDERGLEVALGIVGVAATQKYLTGDNCDCCFNKDFYRGCMAYLDSAENCLPEAPSLVRLIDKTTKTAFPCKTKNQINRKTIDNYCKTTTQTGMG